MKYGFFPRMVWFVFRGSFQKQLHIMTDDNPKVVMKKAKVVYGTILEKIPEFDKNDRFIANILNAAMLAAVYMNMKEKPNLDNVTTYYHKAMNENVIMKYFVKKQNKYSEEAQSKLTQEAKVSQTKTNPYTWKFRYEAGADINSFYTYFDTCGICHLFQELGISEITPAMCTYDYDMAKLGGSVLMRHYTLAEGGSCCDFHYQKK
ncbi:L-2-amino-thiazoline-4-carboxylic acid hydrolase [Clostridium sp. JS66]|uniref:L-2-amino-thiazoline-4-carboxylic acid hydrolase n=1 Tax=Clostridium sp. JS66 TaxID=3064705 RepID=UPI00298E52D2|nr:L-2-amino-thiazoline-4-carboxylic acid hydrolase [Clostridium sp. JS66]WPC40147.1 L-2-amino-thiazoline-4-carboxylic acid hydrolase [Clostridium sp. JS66]